jgi:hypothetical protein
VSFPAWFNKEEPNAGAAQHDHDERYKECLHGFMLPERDKAHFFESMRSTRGYRQVSTEPIKSVAKSKSGVRGVLCPLHQREDGHVPGIPAVHGLVTDLALRIASLLER